MTPDEAGEDKRVRTPEPVSSDVTELIPSPYLERPISLLRAICAVNATGVVNYLALLGFLGYCHLALRARWWLVALVALTTPMVLIHPTVSYVDLFGNALLAIGVSSCLYSYFLSGLPASSCWVGW